MLSCLTNDEILVCLKYCLTELAQHVCPRAHVPTWQKVLMDSRQDLRKLGRGRHDETLVRGGPRDQVLYALVLEHTAEMLVTAS